MAKVIYQRFLQLYPDTQFPLAKDVLDTPDEVLRHVGISRPKISYLKDLASHAIAGLPTLEELEVMDDERYQLIDRLVENKLGGWLIIDNDNHRPQNLFSINLSISPHFFVIKQV